MATARAAEDANKAASKQLIRQGNALLDKGKFGEALEKFDQAYQRFPSAKILFNKAQALHGLQRNLDALLAYRHFLDEAKDSAAEVQAEARQQVADLIGKVGRIEVRCNRRGALVRVDGKEQGSTPLPEPIFVAPGDHTVTLEWEGEQKSASVAAPAGAVTAHEAVFQPRPGRIELACNRDGAVVRIDGKEIGKTPLAEKQLLPPGEHTLTVEWEGLAKSQVVAVVEGGVTSLNATFEDRPPVVVVAPSPPPAPPSPSPWYRSRWVWVAGGAVVAAAATTVVLLYAGPDRFPEATMGKQAIGD